MNTENDAQYRKLRVATITCAALFMAGFAFFIGLSSAAGATKRIWWLLPAIPGVALLCSAFALAARGSALAKRESKKD